MKIYLFDDYDKVNDEVLIDIIRELPEARRSKALRYRTKSDKISCAISYKLLCYGLRYDYGIGSFSIVANNNEKPYIKEYDHIYFNISHCKYGCACIIADCNVGIDIQDYRIINDKVIDRVCSVAEKKQLYSSNNKCLEFTKIWAMKEAYLKMLGVGIAVDLTEIDTSALQNKIYCKTFDKYVLAVAAEGEIENEKIQLDYSAEKHLEFTEIL